MDFLFKAACVCHRGNIRSTNEDNFYFDGKHMEMEHGNLSHPVCMEGNLTERKFLAVFDGMGGENFGERASFEAAHAVQKSLQDNMYLRGEKDQLKLLVEEMNKSVVHAQEELLTSYMGTTLVSLYFTAQNVYVCNLGDSRAFRLRNQALEQLSRDHVDHRPLKPGRKPALSQYIGMGSEEMQLSPYIAMGKLELGDKYLLCSDGLTDMVSNFEIADILIRSTNVMEAAEALLQAALEAGGQDNITVIVSSIC